jgi:hypothetical protein
MRCWQRERDGDRRLIKPLRSFSPLRVDASSRRHRGIKSRAQLDAKLKNLVDFSFRNSLTVTLVSRPTQIDHHFFLDFTFY